MYKNSRNRYVHYYGYKNRPYDNASLDAWSDLYPPKTINKNK